MINEERSVFDIADFKAQKATYFRYRPQLDRIVRKIVPSINSNIRTKRNYRGFVAKLMEKCPRPRILVIGGGIPGQGMSCLLDNRDVDVIETDVSLAPRTMLVCDAHDIPFANASFDGVVAQAVLEHVVDPYRCVEEIHRILKPRGLVYAETPFCQQVHGRQYDFTRFTELGHRRLFRRFKQHDSGVCCGPGTALAWAIQYFLLSFVTDATARNVVIALARLSTFWIKYFDYIIGQQPGAFDAASAYYFMGERSEACLSDRELLKLYRGMNG